MFNTCLHIINVADHRQRELHAEDTEDGLELKE